MKPPSAADVTGVGANAEAVRRAGVNTKRITLAVYALKWIRGGDGGNYHRRPPRKRLLECRRRLRTRSHRRGCAGRTSWFGGRGTMLGTMLGVLYLSAVIGNGLILYHMSPFITPIVEGFIILIAVWLNFRLFRTGRRTS